MTPKLYFSEFFLFPLTKVFTIIYFFKFFGGFR